MRKPCFERLRVLRGRPDAPTSGGTEYNGNLSFPTKHVSCFSGLVHDIIHHVHDEVHKRHIHDGTHSGHRGTYRGTRYSVFRNGSIANSLFSKLLEHPDGCTEVASEDTHVFTHQKHVLIAAHLLGHGHVDGIANGH